MPCAAAVGVGAGPGSLSIAVAAGSSPGRAATPASAGGHGVTAGRSYSGAGSPGGSRFEPEHAALTPVRATNKVSAHLRVTAPPLRALQRGARQGQRRPALEPRSPRARTRRPRSSKARARATAVAPGCSPRERPGLLAAPRGSHAEMAAAGVRPPASHMRPGSTRLRSSQARGDRAKEPLAR